MPINTHTIIITKLLINIIYVFWLAISLGLCSIIILYGITQFFTGEADSILGQIDISSYLNAETFGVSLIQFAIFLCYLLSVLIIVMTLLAFLNSGSIKKNKWISFLFVIGFIFLIETLTSIKIIPFTLFFNYTESKFILIKITEASYEISSDFLIYMEAHNYPNMVELIDSTKLFWSIIGIFAGYITSYKLIKNHLDLE